MTNRLKRIVTAVVVLIVLGMVIVPVHFYSGRPQIKTDYLSIMNTPILAIPETDRGWAVYRDLWIRYDFGEGGSGTFEEIYLQPSSFKARRLVRPADAGAWEMAVQTLADCEDLLEGFRVGAQRRSFGLPFYNSYQDYSQADLQAMYPATYMNLLHVVSPSPLDSIAGHWFSIPKMTDLLAVDCRRAIEQNDVERATRDIEAVLGIARQISESRMVLGGMLAIALQAQGIELVDECVQAQVNFDAQQLLRLQRAIEKCPIDDLLRFSVEQLYFSAMIEHSFTDDGHGDGRITYDGLALMNPNYHPVQSELGQQKSLTRNLERIRRYLAAPSELINVVRRRPLTEKANEFFGRVDNYLSAPVIDETAQAFETDLAALPGTFYPLKRYLEHAVRLRPDLLQRRGDQAGAIAGLAVLRYQKDTGSLPETLENLVGNYLREIPLDPMDGQPARYTSDGTDFYLYSVGPNLRDDGGTGQMRDRAGKILLVPVLDRQQENLRPVPTREYSLSDKRAGDWILWPRYSQIE